MNKLNLKTESDDSKLLLSLFPFHIAGHIQSHYNSYELNEIIIDLGKKPEIRFQSSLIILTELPEVTHEDIQHVVEHVGKFNSDNRAGIERTLHRISAMRNRSGRIIGLTCRIGRAIVGTIEIVRDIIETEKNILIVGPPGSGKTTLLRESARVLADTLNKRVIVVDTSNEIAGDGDIPHPGIGHARRMQVPAPNKQHATMIEAVENHTPEFIIVDEIGTEEEAHTARTIAERGVHLIATAHGRTLENLIKNPIISDLVGGVQSVILGDEEAKFRGTKKTVLERKATPTFDILIELKDRDTFIIYHNVQVSVDKQLNEEDPKPEIRIRNQQTLPYMSDADADKTSINVTTNAPKTPSTPSTDESLQPPDKDMLYIYPYGIKSTAITTTIKMLNIPAKVVRGISDASIILTTESKMKGKSKVQSLSQNRDIPIHIIKSSSQPSLTKFFRWHFKISATEDEIEEESLIEIEELCKLAIHEKRIVEASPRSRSNRRIQHDYAQAQNLNSSSIGEEPNRRVRVYPATKGSMA